MRPIACVCVCPHLWTCCSIKCRGRWASVGLPCPPTRRPRSRLRILPRSTSRPVWEPTGAGPRAPPLGAEGHPAASRVARSRRLWVPPAGRSPPSYEGTRLPCPRPGSRAARPIPTEPGPRRPPPPAAPPSRLPRVHYARRGALPLLPTPGRREPTLTRTQPNSRYGEGLWLRVSAR